MGRGQRRESCHRGARAARRGTLRAPPRALGLGTPPPPRTCWARQGEGTCSENWRGCPRARPSPSAGGPLTLYMLCHPSIHIFLCSSLHRSPPRTGVSPFVSLCETRWSWRRLVGMASLAVSAKHKKNRKKRNKKTNKKARVVFLHTDAKSLGAPSMHCASPLDGDDDARAERSQPARGLAAARGPS